MRYLIIILSVIIFNGCRSHRFENITPDDPTFKNIISKNTIDLKNYKAYYNVVFRNEDQMETIISDQTISTNKIHICDVQYLLINDSAKKFIQIAYIPSRYIAGGNKYYIDTFAIDYSSKINTYYISQIHFGEIVGDTLIYKYKTASYKESKKLVKVNFTVNDEKTDLTLTKFKTNEFDSTFSLPSMVDSKHLTFKLMKNYNLIFYGSDDKRSYELKNEITLTTFNRSKRTDKVIYPLGNGKRNMIIFKLQGVKVSNGNSFIGFWYGEKSERFKFLYP